MTTLFRSPLGELYITSGNDGIRSVLWQNERKVYRGLNELHRIAHRQLKEFFEGRRKEFDLPLQIEGSDFQKSVWHELLQIDYGHVSSYGEIAIALGDAKKSRAVGAAVGSNPLMIIVPCHRVVGKDESLTGYAGGVSAKQHLLDMESGQLDLFRSK